MKPNKAIFFSILIILIINVFSSCSKRQILLEAEQIQIQNFLDTAGTDFDTLPSGVLLRIDTSFDSIPIYVNDEILLVYTGINLDDNNKVFAKQDSIYIQANDPLLLDGWREIFMRINNKTYGTALFPFYTAYDKKRIANVIPYSTLVFYFYVQKKELDTLIK